MIFPNHKLTSLKNLNNRKCLPVSILLTLFLLPNLTLSQNLRWQLAVPKAIQINPEINAWHSGRVQDMVDFSDGSVIVGTNGGGIWWANKAGESRPLSDSWDDPDITSVERGPFSQSHIYVSTASNLYENQSPALDDFQLINKPPGTSIVRDIGILHGAWRIVVACNNGLFWSDIPRPGAPRQYNWRIATGSGAASYLRTVSTRSTGARWWAPAAPTAERLLSNPEMATVSRSPANRDVFWIGSRGDVMSAWNVLGYGWTGQTFSTTGPGMAHTTSRLAVIARGEWHLDVFFVGPDGELRTTWWDNADGNWQAHTYTILGAGSARPGGGITAIARTPDTIDLIWTAPDRSIKHVGWSGGAWTTPALVTLPGGAAATTRIAAVSRSSDVLNVFWITASGEVRTNWWQQGNDRSWRNVYTIPSLGPASIRGGISAAARDQNKLDLIWVTADGRLMTTYWNQSGPEQWVGHAYALTAQNAVSTEGNVALIARNPLQLDVFWQAVDGTVRTNWWNGLTAPSFSSQSYRLGSNGIAIRNVVVTGSSPEDMSVYTVAIDGSLVVNRWTSDNGIVLAGVLGANTTPLFRGTFSGNNLVLSAPTLSGGDGNYSSASVSISKYGTAAYAAVANPVGFRDPATGVTTNSLPLKYVFRSDNLGETWISLPTLVSNLNMNDGSPGTLQGIAQGQGFDWNNTIAASPVNNDVAYLGWVQLFATVNGGQSWQRLWNQHLHTDIAKVTFGEFDRSSQTVFFNTDGGLSATFDQNQTFYSRYNERLATLQCYTTDSARQFDGTLGVSYQTRNLIVAGLQDNGNVWAIHGDSWKGLDGGDGGYFTFIRTGHALRRMMNSPFKRAEWNGSALVDQGEVTIARSKPGLMNPPTTLNGGFAIVNAPLSWDAFGARIHGFGWTGVDIYSLWNPSGVMGWRWEYENSIPMAAGEFIAAGGSANGQVSFYATSLGRIFSYDRRTNTVSRNTVDTTGIPNAADYGINRLTILSDTLGYALLNRWRNGVSEGYVLRFDGTRWAPLLGGTLDGAPLPIERHWSLEADWTMSPATLLLTTDDKVYLSQDREGRTWRNQSDGLPQRAHLADLRFVVFPGGIKRFYVSTFGRSVWFTEAP